MRPERNPLDLNNLPEEYRRDGKQNLQGSSSVTSEASGFRKKKSGRNDGKDECGKVYECRFCSLKFCKSQALGGHMNRHRQERETETLNRARQLVLDNENLAAHGALHLGLRDPDFLGGSKSISSGNFHQSGNMGEPCLPFTSVHPTTLFISTSSPISSPPPPPPYQAYFYHSQPMNDYLVGHVFPAGNSHQHINLNYLGDQNDTNYTCIGAPIGQSFRQEDRTARMADMSVPEGGEGDGSLHNQQDGLKWGRGYAGKQKRIDHFSINRFQDGF